METLLLKYSPESVKTAARILRRGGLAAIPTETVYGLAANAFDEAAVRSIFAAKGRPSDNPLIVHISELSQLGDIAAEIPDGALTLARRFWPGPLTIIMPKSAVIPFAVSGGLDTVAVRMPSHPAARAVISESGLPLAAPSANSSGLPSPTTAAHVLADLGGKIDCIIDGGECSVGVESTVLSLAEGIPVVLRPGAVTPEQIAEALGSCEVSPAVTLGLSDGERAASPGMKYKHYSPKAKVVIINAEREKYIKYVNQNKGVGVAAMCFDGDPSELNVPSVCYGSEGDDESQARELFAALRRLDEIGAKLVYARCPSKHGVGLAVYNRLLRAAAFEEMKL